MSYLGESSDAFSNHLEYGRQPHTPQSGICKTDSATSQLRTLIIFPMMYIHIMYIYQEKTSLERKSAGVFCSVNGELCVLLERCLALITLMGVRLCMRLHVLTQTL